MEGRKIGVYYYPWFKLGYGTPASHWSHDMVNMVRHKPTLGYYDSGSDTVIAQHMAWIRDTGGMDFVIVSWWPAESYITSNADKVVTKIKSMTGLQVCILLEGYAGGDTAQWQEAADHVYNNWVIDNSKYFNYEDHPAFTEKPLLLIYPTDQVKGSFTDARFVVRWLLSQPYASQNTEGVWAYDGEPGMYGGLWEKTNGAGITMNVTEQCPILPGRSDLPCVRYGKFWYASFLPRNVYVFEDMWKKAMGYPVDIITVTSFNEWHEETCLEPCEAWGTEYLSVIRRMGGICAEIT